MLTDFFTLYLFIGLLFAIGTIVFFFLAMESDEDGCFAITFTIIMFIDFIGAVFVLFSFYAMLLILAVTG